MTIYDVAREAGVSKSTVSRVISGRGYVSEEAAGRVKEAMRRLGYQPNHAARALANQDAQTIGLAVADIADPFYSEIIRGAEHEARRHGYNLLLCSTGFDPETEWHYVQMLRQRRVVDGLLFVSTGAFVERSHIERLMQTELPFVLVSRRVDGVDVTTVNVDDRDIGFRAGRYLVSLGHRDIAFVGPYRKPSGRDRLAGLRQALAEVGTEVPDSWLIHAEYTVEAGVRAGKALMAAERRPRAVFAANDKLALGIMRALRRSGVNVPHDMSVMGVDDLEMAALADPPLTTLRQPRYEMGRMGMEALVRQLKGDVPVSVVYTLRAELVERESCLVLEGGDASR